jgi:hypothetical protein
MNHIIPVAHEDMAYFDAQMYLSNEERLPSQHWKNQLPWFKRAVRRLRVFHQDIAFNRIKECHLVHDLCLTLEGNDNLALKRIQKQEGVTLGVLVQFAWHKILHLHTKKFKTIVLTTVSGRNIAVSNIDESVGCYIKSLPTICDWSARNNTGKIIQGLHQSMIALNECVISENDPIGVEFDRIESEIVFQNMPQDFLPAHECDHVISATDVPLTLKCFPAENTLELHFLYNFLYVSHAEAKKVFASLQSTFKALIDELDPKIS